MYMLIQCTEQDNYIQPTNTTCKFLLSEIDRFLTFNKQMCIPHTRRNNKTVNNMDTDRIKQAQY